jgi:hypothetical protein
LMEKLLLTCCTSRLMLSGHDARRGLALSNKEGST